MVRLEPELEREQGREREREQQVRVKQQAAVVVEVAVASASLSTAEVDKLAHTESESTPEVGPHRVTWLEYPCKVSLCMAS